MPCAMREMQAISILFPINRLPVLNAYDEIIPQLQARPCRGAGRVCERIRPRGGWAGAIGPMVIEEHGSCFRAMGARRACAALEWTSDP